MMDLIGEGDHKPSFDSCSRAEAGPPVRRLNAIRFRMFHGVAEDLTSMNIF